ncbi:linear amide C-N hydrolase [Bifidobacterium sp. ESL0763]|uniref:linear amide C-N hydrolase n=1 Tax=Bifidobacterium sp. ESL0763 TaxID=2983227 RepID=UPI0023F8D557|nr:linear amide C-N hydrolase [Bifidobacterium sp. ESL0763]MDF7664073.1 linear amide C-N hydrolase [Bifidobacterium sp. ESL0763]
MCTGIEMISKQGHPYWGRTQDFEQNFEYAGIRIPAGTMIESTYTPFRTKRAVMGIVWAQDVHRYPVVLDGINDKGICGGSFYFDHFFRYAPTDEIRKSGKTALRGEELVTWILTQYATLDEIAENLNDDLGITTDKGPMMGMSVPQHAVFQDESGRSIVVEPSKENGFRVFDNKLGVFTNAPTFDWHLNNVKTHLERSTYRTYTYRDDEPIDTIPLGEPTSGLVGIPADYKPESRFLRAAYAKLLSVEVDDGEAVNQIFQLLGCENTPKGLLRIRQDDGTIFAWTQYTAVYDIVNKALYAHTYDNRTVRLLEFGDPERWGQTQYFRFYGDKPIYVPFERW